MKWNVKPLRGVGDVKFGMKPDEVRRAVNSTYEPFRRYKEKHLTDYFPELGLFAYYTPRGRLEALEMAPPAAPKLGNKNLLTLPFDALMRKFARRDPDLTTYPEGFTAPNVGLGVYAPGFEEEPNRKPEAVIVFRKGYYDT